MSLFELSNSSGGCFIVCLAPSVMGRHWRILCFTAPAPICESMPIWIFHAVISMNLKSTIAFQCRTPAIKRETLKKKFDQSLAFFSFTIKFYLYVRRMHNCSRRWRKTFCGLSHFKMCLMMTGKST